MDPQTNPFTRLHQSAAWADQVLQRVSGEGGVLDQMQVGEWDDRLTEEVANDIADMVDAVAEHVRSSRALAGGLGMTPGGAQTVAVHFREMTRSHLPLNRKERFYTGTVLPMLIASDGFAYLDRFLHRCGLPDVQVDANLDGDQALEFFTEYGFTESLRKEDRERFSGVPTRDTPDVVLAGPDWLLAVEAKMFHRPTSTALNDQLGPQRALVEAWARDMDLPGDRVRHVLLLPDRLAREVRAGVEAPVITWEEVLNDYRVVGPAYWLGVLDEALSRYDDLVSAPTTFGANAEAHLTGAHIVKSHAEGTLTYNHVGRRGGLNAQAFVEDVVTGKWRDTMYEVRQRALDDNPNWFPMTDFLGAVASGDTGSRPNPG